MKKELDAAVNTLKAGWFEVFLAKLFGKKLVSEDSGCVVTMHYWRKKYYLTDCKIIKPSS